MGIKNEEGFDIPENMRNKIQINVNYVEKNGEKFKRTLLNIEECKEN